MYILKEYHNQYRQCDWYGDRVIDKDKGASLKHPISLWSQWMMLSAGSMGCSTLLCTLLPVPHFSSTAGWDPFQPVYCRLFTLNDIKYTILWHIIPKFSHALRSSCIYKIVSALWGGPVHALLCRVILRQFYAYIPKLYFRLPCRENILIHTIL